MPVRYDPRTIKDNLGRLLAEGIGRVRGGVPEFNSDDVRRHAIATGQASPLTIPQPPADLASSNAFKFDQLDDPNLTGVEKINTRIGELQARKFEEKANLLSQIDTDTEVAGAKTILGGLQIQRSFSFARPEVVDQIDREIKTAQKSLVSAEKSAVTRLNRQFEINTAQVDAEIARLTATQENLLARQASQARTKTSLPRRTIEAIKAGHDFTDDSDADKFFKSAPRNIQRMWGFVGSKTGVEQAEYWNPNIQTGDIDAYDRYLLSIAKPSEQPMLIDSIRQTKGRLGTAQQQAVAIVAKEAKEGGPAGLALLKDEDARFAREAQVVDGLMRQGNIDAFQARTLGGNPDQIRTEWYDDPALYNLAVELQQKIPPDAASLEEGLVVALNDMELPPTMRTVLLEQYLGERVMAYNTVGRYTGTQIAQTTARTINEAIALKMHNIDIVKRHSEQTRQGLGRGAAMQRSTRLSGEGTTPTANFNRGRRGGFIERQAARKIAQEKEIEDQTLNLLEKIEEFGPNVLSIQESRFLRTQGQDIPETLAEQRIREGRGQGSRGSTTTGILG